MRTSQTILIGVVGILVLSTLGETSAQGFFGPKTYDDCILESMKGVTSNLAAATIMKSCREKFPEPKIAYPAIPDVELRKIDVIPPDYSNIGGGSFADSGPEATIKFNVYNGSDRWTVKELFFSLETIDGKPAPEELRRRVVAQSVDVSGLRNGEFIMYARELGITAGSRTRISVRVVNAKGAPAGR